MTCPFKRCQDQVTHCDGACHGVMPDGSPMLERAIFNELMPDHEDRALVEKCWEASKNPWDGPIMYELLQLKAKQ